MPQNIGSVANMITKSAENTVPMTLTSTISAGATTVPVSGMTNYTDGDFVCFVVDPSTPGLKQVFTGQKSGGNVINVTWTEMPTGGSNVGHAGGATVVDYVTATHWDLLRQSLLTGFNPNGNGLLTSAVQTALNISGGSAGGWTPLGFTPSNVVYNGNRSYTLTFASDLTSILSPKMRFRTTRSVAAPTQATLLNGTNQFWNKTSPAGMTFTDDFVVSAWIKITSYPASTQAIASRYNGTSGWDFAINTSGQIFLRGFNAGSANNSVVISAGAIPLNKWVHVAAQLDMSSFTATPTTSYVMFDGLDVPASVTRAGTNPTALIQAGNLEIGSENGGTAPFGGEIAQLAIYSAKVTEATIAASSTQSLAGTETSLISAFSFNGNANDLNTTNANNLTANNGVTATNADSPYGAQGNGTVSSTLDYCIIQSISFSVTTTCVVQVPEGGTIPTSGGLANIFYSGYEAPYLFPGNPDKWTIVVPHFTTDTQSSPSALTWYNAGSNQINLPIGVWNVEYEGSLIGVSTGAQTQMNIYSTLSTANNSESDPDFSAHGTLFGASGSLRLGVPVSQGKTLTLAAMTLYYLNVAYGPNTGSSVGFEGAIDPTYTRAVNAYL